MQVNLTIWSYFLVSTKSKQLFTSHALIDFGETYIRRNTMKFISKFLRRDGYGEHEKPEEKAHKGHMLENNKMIVR